MGHFLLCAKNNHRKSCVENVIAKQIIDKQMFVKQIT